MSKTLEELQAELDAEMAADAASAKAKPSDTTTKVETPSKKKAGGAPPKKKPPASGGGDDGKSPKKARGLMDFALTCALAYGVYAMTPVGAIGEAAFRFVLGQKDAPSFFATFRGRETDVQVKAPEIKTGLLASKTVPRSVADAAAGNGVDAELLITLLSTNGQCDSAGCTLKKPRYLDIILDQEVGDVVTVAQVAQGINRAAHKLGVAPRGVGGELGVEALYVGPVPTRLALEQAKATGIANAEDVEAHAQFFAPSIRRGALQSALAVLALHRLRTLAWPAKGKWRISSPFGYRTHPVLGTKKFHNGTDLAVPTGTSLMAVQRGVIKRARRDSVCGKYVKINYGFGIESTYCHMNKLLVEKNARVAREQEVGKSGSTGRVTGPHLHYILRVNGDPVDAEMYGASPTRKKAQEGEDPLGKIEAAAAAAGEVPTPKKAKKKKKKKAKSKATTKSKKSGGKKTPSGKTKAKKQPASEGAPNSAADVDAGAPAEVPSADDPSPAMPAPDGDEGVPLEDVRDVKAEPTPNGDAAPKDAAPKDAAPKDAAPKDAAPKDAAAKDAAPTDAAKKAP